MELKNKILLVRILAILAGIAILNLSMVVAYGTVEMIILTNGIVPIAFTAIFPLTVITTSLALYLILTYALMPLMALTTKRKEVT